MKNLIKFSSIALLFVFIIFSCKKDDDEPEVEYNLNTEYFTVADAAYVQDEFPEASNGTVPVIDVINGNPSVIPGGSNPIAIESGDTFSKILIGVNGVSGYYSLPASNAKTSGEYLFYILMNQTLIVSSFDIVIALLDANGLVSEHSIITVSLVEVGTGKLQVSLSWDQINDVDLHLVEPNGAEIYYAIGSSANGGELDLDSNAGCNLDYVNNENITYAETTTVESGEYIVRVDFWDVCNVTEITNYSVTAYYEGALLSPSVGTNPSQGSFATDEWDNGGAGSGVTVMKFNIPSGKSLDTKTVYKVRYPSDKVLIKNLSPHKS